MTMKTLEQELREILSQKPETRDSNEALYAEYLERHHITFTSVEYFFRKFKDFRVCSFESVTRVRRKIVEKTPELGASESMKRLRHERECDIWDYAKDRGELNG